jgi:hypothetical protein
MAKAKTGEKAETAADRSPKARTGGAANVTGRDIARHAYDLYLARGYEHGHDVDDWLQAERELQIDSEC